MSQTRVSVEVYARPSAAGSESFINQIADTLSLKVRDRETAVVGDSFVVREPSVPYSAHFDSKMEALRHKNMLLWKLSN